MLLLWLSCHAVAMLTVARWRIIGARGGGSPASAAVCSCWLHLTAVWGHLEARLLVYQVHHVSVLTSSCQPNSRLASFFFFCVLRKRITFGDIWHRCPFHDPSKKTAIIDNYFTPWCHQLAHLSSLILAHWFHYVKTWRDPHNWK